jgi:hypothetical protein
MPTTRLTLNVAAVPNPSPFFARRRRPRRDHDATTDDPAEHSPSSEPAAGAHRLDARNGWKRATAGSAQHAQFQAALPALRVDQTQDRSEFTAWYVSRGVPSWHGRCPEVTCPGRDIGGSRATPASSDCCWPQRPATARRHGTAHGPGAERER